MAKKVLTQIKLQAVGGQASPAPPVGPALGQHGINIMEFCKAFNAQTQQDAGTTIPVVITVYEDRSFTFVTKTPPAAVLIKQAINLDKGSGEPHRGQVAPEHEYTPGQGIELIKALPAPRFDETLEVHIRTGLNVRHADEQLRGT